MHLYFYGFSDETIHVAVFCGKEFGYIASCLEDRTFSIPHHDKFRSHDIKVFRGVEDFRRNIGLYENVMIVSFSNRSV